MYSMQVLTAAGLLQQHTTYKYTSPDLSSSAGKDGPSAIPQPAGLLQASDAAGHTGGQQATQPAAGHRAAQAAAEAAAASPLQPTSTIAILMGPSPEYVVAVLACVAIGCADHPKNLLLA